MASRLLTAALALALAVAVAGGGCGRSGDTPASVQRVADRAWSFQGCEQSDQSIERQQASYPVAHGVRRFVVFCGAKNPTGMIAIVGEYASKGAALSDAKAYTHGPACLTPDHHVVIGHFYGGPSRPGGTETGTAAQGVRQVCDEVTGTYVR